MNTKDAAALAVLASMKMRKEPELTPDEEAILMLALDPEEQFRQDVMRIFTDNSKSE